MSYHVCQVVGKSNPLIPPYPLQKVPIVGEAFSKVFLYVVGPLPKRRSGNQFLLTIMFLTTQTPIPLWKVTAPVVVSVLLKYFKYTALPSETQSDRGTNFMSNLIQQVLTMLDIRQMRSAALHPVIH